MRRVFASDILLALDSDGLVELEQGIEVKRAMNIYALIHYEPTRLFALKSYFWKLSEHACIDSQQNDWETLTF